MPQHLITPHGGELVDLIAEPARANHLRETSKDWTSWHLTDRQICDLELISNGGFSPLIGFMGENDYTSVCEKMRLVDGTLWSMPITFDVTEEFALGISKGEKIALRDPEGIMLAVLTVTTAWKPDKASEAVAVFGTASTEHPAVNYLMNVANDWYVGGTIEAIQLPDHYDFAPLRLTPKEQRFEFARLGWRNIIGFQTRNPMHRAHFELTTRAIRENEANLLIHPVVGMTKPGDIDHYTRVRCYQALMPHYPHNTVQLALLPLAMRMGGPREALWHAIIRKNYGCTHLIIGRDHAGPGTDSSGTPFYGPYEAQELFTKYHDELDMKMVPFQLMVYLEEKDTYMPIDEVGEKDRTSNISGTELRERLAEGREIPHWFTFPEISAELRKSHPPKATQGFTVFFTGLSGSGKSTVARALLVKLLELGGRPITLLDGDIVRKNLSSELGFSKEHRDLNILRIGFVANEITKNGGIALCAPIAPYERIRDENRALISPNGGYILVYMSTPLAVCEQRDRKGLYAKARAGVLKEFTGISDPYEEPVDADLKIDTSDITPDEAAQQIVLHLEHLGYITGV